MISKSGSAKAAKIIIVLGLLGVFFGADVWAGGCGDPRAQNCNPGYYLYDDPKGREQCLPCTGSTVANGCTRSCITCGSGTTPNSDHSSCIALPACPATLKGSTIAAIGPWSNASGKPGYYAPDSAILTQGGLPDPGDVSLNTLQTEMGSAFSGATFHSPIQGSGSAFPAGVIECTYQGPWFTYKGKTLTSTITIACPGSCGSL